MAAYWLAKEAKIFEKHGLSVDVVLIESGVTTVQALTAGETQIAMGGGTVAVSSNLAGSDIVSISSIESRMPYALLAQKEIKTIDQLKGKRLAVSRFGSASDLAARLILQRYGLTPDKDVTILQTGGTSTRLSALSKRSVDCTVLTPEFFNLGKKAGFTILVDPTQYDIPFPQLEVITTRAYLKAQPEVITRYMRAIVEGIYMVKQNPGAVDPGAEKVSEDRRPRNARRSLQALQRTLSARFPIPRPRRSKPSSPGWRKKIPAPRRPNPNSSSTARSCARSKKAASRPSYIKSNYVCGRSRLSYFPLMPSSLCTSRRIERSATSLRTISRSTFVTDLVSSMSRRSPSSGRLPSSLKPFSSEP